MLKNVVAVLRSTVRLRPITVDRVQRRLRSSVTVADMRRTARRVLPRGVFDYIDGGAEDERTMVDNAASFARVRFKPRVLRDVGEVDTAAMLLDQRLPLPLVLAPTGFTRIAHPLGELAVARAASRAGLPYALSTLGTRSIEDVAAVSTGPLWFQVYVWRDRGLVKEMIDRAAHAGFSALVVTVDTAVLGRRERDVRRGFSLPPKVGAGTLLDGVLHPSWTWEFVRAEPIRFANVLGRDVGDGTDPVSLADYINSQFDPTLSWHDIEWIRSIWNGPILLKGVQTVDDAAIAADVGIDAVMLSNHGGRQLDDAPTPLSLVAPVRDLLGDGIGVVCDGGVRRGSDIVKAVALGADACSIGRPYLYALATAGEQGVDHLLRLLETDMRRTMALVGARRVSELSRELVGDVASPVPIAPGPDASLP